MTDGHAALDNHQILAAEQGWAETEPEDPAARPLPYDASFCGHGLTQADPDATFVVADPSKEFVQLRLRARHNQRLTRYKQLAI